jgi:hypothetical protein
MAAARRALLPLSAAVLLLGGCGTVDLGDNIVPPDLALDEDFFFCNIQPNVLTMYSCAGGEGGEGGSCHTAQSALRLVDTTEPAPCDVDGNVIGAVPLAYRSNLDAVRFTIQSDPLSSPFYRRPIGLASHPRVIFEEGSPPAELIVEWLSSDRD